VRPEDRFVERLREALSEREGVLVGPGDDAAVVSFPTGRLVVTTDTLVENVDFLPGEDPARLCRRAVSVSLSDLAAMGAWPDFFLLTIGFPESAGEDLPFTVARSAAKRGEEFGAALVGGDLSRADEIFLSVAVWGRPSGGVVRRSGAKPGDAVFLSGWPGEAAAGLAIARARSGENRTPAEDAWTPEELPAPDETRLLAAYRDPEPRLPLGRALGRDGIATAAIDVSDGLGVDAGRLARASGVRVVLDSESLPISSSLAAFAEIAGRDAVEMALSGGDDYELLFTVSAELAGSLADPPAEWGAPVWRIGRVESGTGAFLEGAGGLRPIDDLGFDHFGSAP
jgi:thiamine-monophosphate kinase